MRVIAYAALHFRMTVRDKGDCFGRPAGSLAMTVSALAEPGKFNKLVIQLFYDLLDTGFFQYRGRARDLVPKHHFALDFPPTIHTIVTTRRIFPVDSLIR